MGAPLAVGKNGIILPGQLRPIQPRNLVVPHGLANYWGFDLDCIDTANSRAFDPVSGNHGTLIGATKPSLTTGQVGKALAFDGSTGYVDTTNLAGVTHLTPFSISLWAYSTSDTSFAMCQTAKEESPFDGVWFLWGTGANHNKLHITLNATAGSKEGIQATAAQSLNTWYHCVGTYDGSQTIGGLKLYINGAQIATNTVNNTGFGAFTDRAWRIGADTAGTPADFFAGNLDEIRIYNRGLDAGDVAMLYQAGVSGRRDAWRNLSIMLDSAIAVPSAATVARSRIIPQTSGIIMGGFVG